MSRSIWTHGENSGYEHGQDLVGYAVEAVDGRIGHVDRHSPEVGAAHLVVDTGAWIFGKRVLLPAGTVVRIDHPERIVHVDRSKEEIKAAPEYRSGEDALDPGYFQLLGGYYGPIL
ncbi:PRC-barrel domain containing protein [Kitasatospora sp. NPDC056138]|uniref:PRC-barrel domain containing protein n=1 Tax=Kitasatospora sp. NPDC056138 TaxID=3345724 RepID=UPI0035D65A9F